MTPYEMLYILGLALGPVISYFIADVRSKAISEVKYAAIKTMLDELKLDQKELIERSRELELSVNTLEAKFFNGNHDHRKE